jgi:glycosyltransferase involved in cell wall biosynthesis
MPDPLHLAFVVESGTDVRLVEGLAERFRLTILARRIPGGAEVNHPPRVPVPTEIGPAGRLPFARWMRRRLEATRPDRVLVQGYGAAALAAHLGRRRVPTFMLVCSPVEAYYRCRRPTRNPRMPYKPHELWGLSALARLNASLGQHYVVLSEHLADVVRTHGGRRRVSVIPVYGVDTTRFAPSSEPRHQRKATVGLPTDRPVIFFSSRIAPEKDAETLLEALGRLSRDGLRVHVLHRSGGFREFAAAAERAGLDRVTATDARHPDTLPPDYQAADLCVQASREEGLGFSPLEALACGTPVVAAAVGGLRETIIAGETGWTYPPGDAVALAAAIRDALRDPAEAERRALRGRELVQRRYEKRDAFTRLAALLA